MSNWIKVLKAGYLYVIAGITLVMTIMGSTMIIQNVITYNILDLKQDRWGETPEVVCQWKYQEPSEDAANSIVSEYNYDSFEDCVETETKLIEERARVGYAYDMAQAIALLLIALPVWAYHWRIIRKGE